MSVPRSRKEKRTWAEEAARVVAIWRALYDEFRPTDITLSMEQRLDILAVADRIAARTED